MVESSMDSCKFSQQKPLERDKDYHMVMAALMEGTGLLLLSIISGELRCKGGGLFMGSED